MKHEDLGIRGLLAGYRSGERAPVEVLRRAHDRAEQYAQPVWITLLDWDAVAEYIARLGDPALPLYGIPFAIKDNIDLAGTLTTAACPAFGYLPRRSAFVALRLIAAGAIPFGKTNLDQFATGLVGTRSPYGACRSVVDPRYISGGSSSGSAVAVAAGLVSFALGTDTAGSGRVPAAFNGIVGLKPSGGRLSTSGVVPACRTLDCVSIFAGDVADARLVFEAAAAGDPADPYSRRPPRPAPVAVPAPPASASSSRLGVPRAGQLDFYGDAQAQAAWVAALARARGLGLELVEIDIDPYVAAGRLLYQGAWIAERAAAVGEFVAAHPDDVDAVVAGIIAGGGRPSAVDAFRSAYRLAELRRLAAGDWERIDALLLPTAPTIYTPAEVAADTVATSARLGTYTNFVNLMELCAVAVPADPRADGLPFGVSLIGPRDADELVLDLAATWLGEPPHALPPPEPDPTPTPTRVVVVGAHLSGQPLNWQLTDAGGRLEAETHTAAIYRLYALDGARPPKPGLVRAGAQQGAPIEVEVWRLPAAGLGGLAAGVRPPLSIGAVELADGSVLPGFVCDSQVAETGREITAWGGWRAYLAAEAQAPTR